MTGVTLSVLRPDEVGEAEGALAAILLACVRSGASVGFVEPFPAEAAQEFWRGILPGIARGDRVIWLARIGARAVGTVQLVPMTMPNQSHRAEVSKMLVHPDFRRRGIARALLAALQAEAWAQGRSLLTLDTRSGDHAQPLYASMGFQVAGSIPGFARNPAGDGFDATTYMFKHLTGPE